MAGTGNERAFSLEVSENGFVLMQRKADVRQEATRMAKRTTNVTVNPGVVMQMSPSSRAGKTIVSWLVPFNCSVIENDRSPDDTTRITLFSPTSASGSSWSEVERTLRLLSSRLRCNNAGGGPYWDSGPAVKCCTCWPSKLLE